jgi:hypothetical protein
MDSSVDYGHKTENYFSSYAQQEILHHFVESSNLPAFPASSAPMDSDLETQAAHAPPTFKYSTYTELHDGIAEWIWQCPEQSDIAAEVDVTYRLTQYFQVQHYCVNILYECQVADPAIGLQLFRTIERYRTLLNSTTRQLTIIQQYMDDHAVVETHPWSAPLDFDQDLQVAQASALALQRFMDDDDTPYAIPLFDAADPTSHLDIFEDLLEIQL